MKNFVMSSKAWMLALLCVLFLGIGIKAEAAPGTVTGVEQTDDTTNTVQVKWTPTSVGNPVEYQINCYDNPECSGTPYITGTSPTSPVTIDGLSAGKSYYVQISAIDGEKTAGAPSAAIEVVTAPAAKVTNLKQGKLAAKKITLSWNSVDGANLYNVIYRKDGVAAANATLKPTNKASYTISASTDTAYGVCVLPVRESKTGYQAYDPNSVPNTLIQMFMYTTPKKVTKLKLYSTGSNSSRAAGIAVFSAKLSNAADGYQYEIYGNNNKKITSKTVTIASTNEKNNLIQISKGIKSGQFMKIRLRPYVNLNGKKTYGSWSDYLWFAKTPKTVKAEITPSQRVEDGINISWSKITGAKDYSVYVSRSSSSGYKKVATTTGTTYNLRSFNGSQLTSGTYYYYIIANKKVGSKTYKSDDSWYFSKSIRITYSY